MHNLFSPESPISSTRLIILREKSPIQAVMTFKLLFTLNLNCSDFNAIAYCWDFEIVITDCGPIFHYKVNESFISRPGPGFAYVETTESELVPLSALGLSSVRNFFRYLTPFTHPVFVRCLKMFQRNCFKNGAAFIYKESTSIKCEWCLPRAIITI